jgi:cyclopropane-fatty-acyl-phospholipid synthase
MNWSISLAESGLLPDWCIRLGIRRLLAKRLRMSSMDSMQNQQQALIDAMNRDSIAVETQSANEQHYEVPSEFFQRVLGKRLKYSCAYFDCDTTTLDEAEECMLRITCERAELKDGQEILELGCGWGSLTIWMAENYPHSRITAVSNSRTQREFIEERLKQKNLRNVQVVTCDVSFFKPEIQFDRIVSVEMFEHLRNYRDLFHRIAGWLRPDGALFVHIFCHRNSTYLFETQGSDNWMGRYFFTGGTMPSANLFSQVQQELNIEKQWKVSGLHYWRTCEAWLQRLDEQRSQLLGLFASCSAGTQPPIALQRWRMFMMACAELFRYRSGEEWFVSHYLFRPASPGRSQVLLSAQSLESTQNLESTSS